MQGIPFEWLAQHDHEQLELILATVYENPAECGHHIQKVEEAWEDRNQAGLWLSHLATLNFDKTELDQSRKFAASEKSRQAQKAAQKPRKAQRLTPELVARCFSERHDEKWENVRDELATEHQVSGRTVARRLKEAREKNLVS